MIGKDKLQSRHLRRDVVPIGLVRRRVVFNTLNHFSVFCLTLLRSVQSETRAKSYKTEIHKNRAFLSFSNLAVSRVIMSLVTHSDSNVTSA